MSSEAITAILPMRHDEPPAAAPRNLWLFSMPVDLAAFLGSAAASFVLLAIGYHYGLLASKTPDWAWVPAILMIDVAHVWATAFRVYFDPTELKRRPCLYTLVPVLGWAAGVALYAAGSLVFWRTLAYLAVFHFVRQQYGWVALYRARVGETGRLGKWIDTAAIYLATVYPLIYWHAHLPRKFWWFMKGDFDQIPSFIDQLVAPFYFLALALYALRALFLWFVARTPNPGKDVVVATTVVCWYVGIVAINSDYAFTVTNVVIHGIPYLVLVFWYWRGRQLQATESPAGSYLSGIAIFLATLWLIAYAEELIWDRSVWQERGWLFGEAWDADRWLVFLVPLLALPQLTHYVLDGFIWKRRSNPTFTLVTSPDCGVAPTPSAAAPH